MIDIEPGPQAASPAPIPSRPRNSVPKLFAAPHDMVHSAQKAMAADITRRRGKWSISMPAGIAMPK